MSVENPVTVAREVVALQLLPNRQLVARVHLRLKNEGQEPLSTLRVEMAFPRHVEVPGEADLRVFLNANEVDPDNYTLSVEPRKTLVHLTLAFTDLEARLGGVKPGERVRLEFPVFLGLDQALTKALGRELSVQSKLATGSEVETRITALGVEKVEILATGEKKGQDSKQTRNEAGSRASEGEIPSSEQQVIDKFAAMAVEAYNAKLFSAAAEYGHQILEIVRHLGHAPSIQKYETIVARIQEIANYAESHGIIAEAAPDDDSPENFSQSQESREEAVEKLIAAREARADQTVTDEEWRKKMLSLTWREMDRIQQAGSGPDAEEGQKKR